MRVLAAEIAQDGQHQGIRLVTGVQGAIVDVVHVHDIVMIVQLRAVQPGGHGQPPGTDVDQALMHPVAGIRQVDVAEVAQHPRRHLTVVGVLDFQVQDEWLALNRGHFRYQVGAAVFDPLLFGGEQFGVDQFQPVQVVRHVQQEALENAFGQDIFLTHGRYSSRRNGAEDGDRCRVPPSGLPSRQASLAERQSRQVAAALRMAGIGEAREWLVPLIVRIPFGR